MHTSRMSLSRQMFEKDVKLVTHVTLLQHKFSSSLGIGWQTLHLHHSGDGILFKGGSGAESMVINTLAKLRLPLPILRRLTRILSFVGRSRVATNS